MHKPSDPANAATSLVTGEALFGLAGHPPSSSAHPDDDEMLGRRLNDTYLVDGVLGEGGMGRVYRATHTRIPQKLYAIKVLRPDLARDGDQLARFQREAEAAASISHPNVMGVYDIGRTSDGWSYMVCEHLTGSDLDAYLETHGRLDPLSAVRIALQICDALIAAHAQSVVHRDLKPQNVFLLSDGTGKIPAHPTVKVVDFGLSRFLDSADAQLTKTGMIMGTPSFMTPEQANGQRGDHRVDVYGIGAILYAAMTGKAPFEEDTLQATVLAVMISEPVRPRALNPKIPETLELLVQRSLNKNPADRFSTVAELRDALDGFEQSLLADAAQRPSLVPQASTKATRRGGRSILGSDVYDVRTSRPKLVYFLALGVSLGIISLATSVSGLEIFVGRFNFTRTELALLLMGVTGSLLVPAFLWLRHFKKTVWSNSARVIDWLETVRQPILSAIFTYGMLSILLRFGDDFVSRFGFEAELGPKPGIAWPGFTWMLPIASIGAGFSAYARQKYVRGDVSAARRYLLGAPLQALTAVFALTCVLIGVAWRNSDVTHQAELAAEAAAKAEAARPQPTPAAPTVVVAPPKPKVIERAPDDELAKAVSAGTDALLPLSEKYPDDAEVLRPLMMAYASRAPTIADAMVVAKNLFAVSPADAASPSVHLLLKKAATIPGEASQLSLTLMSKHMGAEGLTLLYDLSLRDSKVKAEIDAILATKEAQAEMTAAVRIAYALRHAESCDARKPLVERALKLGDERAAAALVGLATKSKTGCGAKERSPCPATCEAEAKEYLAHAKTIALRAKGLKH